MKLMLITCLTIILIACSEPYSSKPPSELYNRWYMIELLDENGEIQNLEKCTHYLEFFADGNYNSGGYVKDSGRWNFDPKNKSITLKDKLKFEILMLRHDTLKYTARRGNKSMTSINVTHEHCDDIIKK
ncbi:hypothetical protein [Brumimicrobium aurantiacum]|uniref:Lipocalin-like domain-containing protein n=1 Tax=Brumimicrobium aurantiacum TaxID=1737063 RepID=A0A3E1EZV3_9FLAO|nr:hypothetical protein [Brumimicrobium aurantiacum]RFC55078.1 hypothetical protein DXU93_04460 [Brumimicrobium aurantiacum]